MRRTKETTSGDSWSVFGVAGRRDLGFCNRPSKSVGFDQRSFWEINLNFANIIFWWQFFHTIVDINIFIVVQRHLNRCIIIHSMCDLGAPQFRQSFTTTTATTTAQNDSEECVHCNLQLRGRLLQLAGWWVDLVGRRSLDLRLKEKSWFLFWPFRSRRYATARVEVTIK